MQYRQHLYRLRAASDALVRVCLVDAVLEEPEDVRSDCKRQSAPDQQPISTRSAPGTLHGACAVTGTGLRQAREIHMARRTWDGMELEKSVRNVPN